MGFKVDDTDSLMKNYEKEARCEMTLATQGSFCAYAEPMRDNVAL